MSEPDFKVKKNPPGQPEVEPAIGFAFGLAVPRPSFAVIFSQIYP